MSTEIAIHDRPSIEVGMSGESPTAGVYGLILHGVPAAQSLLAEVEHGWASLTIRQRVEEPSPVTRTFVDDARGVFMLRGETADLRLAREDLTYDVWTRDR